MEIVPRGTKQNSTIWRSVEGKTKRKTFYEGAEAMDRIMGILNEVPRHTLKSLVSVTRYMLRLEPGLVQTTMDLDFAGEVCASRLE